MPREYNLFQTTILPTANSLEYNLCKYSQPEYCCMFKGIFCENVESTSDSLTSKKLHMDISEEVFFNKEYKSEIKLGLT